MSPSPKLGSRVQRFEPKCPNPSPNALSTCAQVLRGSPKSTHEMHVFVLYTCFYVFFVIWRRRGPAGRGVGGRVNPPPLFQKGLRLRPLGRRILIDFGSQHGAKLGPSWDQVGFIIASKPACFFEARFGFDFAASWARFWMLFRVRNGTQK